MLNWPTKPFLISVGVTLVVFLLYLRIDDLAHLSRSLAIQEAVKDGVYECCIAPPCTMCYWEGNRWNNQTAGTCDCDSLIAEGEEPCPQCVAGLCQKSADGACQVNGN
jgi:hypothetical protein